MITLAAGPLGLTALVVATACTAGSPHPATPSPTALSPATASDVTQRGGCSFLASPGRLKGDGGESRVIMNNGTAYMGCGDGPTMSLVGVDADAATFALGDRRVRVPTGSTATLGPYEVHVISVRGQTVQLELT